MAEMNAEVHVVIQTDTLREMLRAEMDRIADLVRWGFANAALAPHVPTQTPPPDHRADPARSGGDGRASEVASQPSTSEAAAQPEWLRRPDAVVVRHEGKLLWHWMGTAPGGNGYDLPMLMRGHYARPHFANHEPFDIWYSDENGEPRNELGDRVLSNVFGQRTQNWRGDIGISTYEEGGFAADFCFALEQIHADYLAEQEGAES